MAITDDIAPVGQRTMNGAPPPRVDQWAQQAPPTQPPPIVPRRPAVIVDPFSDVIERITAKAQAAIRSVQPRPEPEAPPRRARTLADLTDGSYFTRAQNESEQRVTTRRENAIQERRQMAAQPGFRESLGSAVGGRIDEAIEVGKRGLAKQQQLDPRNWYAEAERQLLAEQGIAPRRQVEQRAYELASQAALERTKTEGPLSLRIPTGQDQLGALDPTDPANPLRTKIPYADQVADKGGRAAATVASTLNPVAQEIGERLPYVPTPGGVADALVNVLVPREVWELALELVPGVGSIDEVERLFREGAPEVVRAVKEVMERPEIARKLGRLGSETGGGTPFDPLGDALDPADILKKQQGPGPVADDISTAAAPSALPAPEALPEPRTDAPTIREIEARSAPLTPEQRARIPRETEKAFYQPRPFAEATESVTERTGNVEKVQDLAQRVPIIRSLFSYSEPMAAARAQKRGGNAIPEAMVRRDLFIGEEKARAHVGFYDWLARNREALGLNGKGIARNVGVRPDAEIPAAVRGRLDDIVEHPEDYVLTPEQAAALTEIRHTINAVTQGELLAGIDVREVMGGYFPRKVTKGPKGDVTSGQGGKLSTRPGHVKPREFEDVRSGIGAGFEYGSPIDALINRIDTGITATANRRTLETVKELGQKPSERVPQSLRENYLAAKDAYKADRSPINEKALEDAKRALRIAATKANEPSLGEQKAFGRIFPKEVIDEIAKYTDIDDPGAIDNFFRAQRALETTGEFSSFLIQNGNLIYRNPVAWWKAVGYGLASIAREPVGYVSRNIDVIREGIEAGAIKPPDEFLLSSGTDLAEWLGKRPIIKQAQRVFEWNIFVGQAEWYKAARRIAETDAERKELGSVIRKATGSMLRPGLTKNQRKAEIGTFFAGRYMLAVNGLAVDALRGGARGREARKTLAMVFAGAAAFTTAGQLATDGTLPNFTDPNNREKQWLSIERPGGRINLFGPFYPYMKAYAGMMQSTIEGKPLDAGDQALFLGRTRLSLPFSSAIDLIMGKNAVGDEIERTPRGIAEYLAKRSMPITYRSLGPKAVDGQGLEGLKEFPESIIQAVGGKANRASEFGQFVNAAEPYLEEAQGDYRAAYTAAGAAGDKDALVAIEYEWEQELRPKLEELGVKKIDGSPTSSPRLEFTQLEDEVFNRADRQMIDGHYGVVSAGASSMDEIKERYVNYWTSVGVKEYGKTEAEARSIAQSGWLKDSYYKKYDEAVDAARLAFWREHPELLDQAVAVGWEKTNEEERKILEEAGY